MTIDIGVKLPWPNRHRPYVAFHMMQWGSSFRGRFVWTVWHCGVMWGRLFTDGRGGMKWWDIEVPRSLR